MSAEGIRRQRTARSLEGPRPRPSANRVVLASAASPFEMRRIVQRLESGRMPVHLCQPVFPNIPDHQRQKPRRTDLTGVRDEYDAMAVANAEAPVGGTAPDLFTRHALGLHLFERHSPVGRRLGGGHHERRDFRRPVDPPHQFFPFLG